MKKEIINRWLSFVKVGRELKEEADAERIEVYTWNYLKNNPDKMDYILHNIKEFMDSIPKETRLGAEDRVIIAGIMKAWMKARGYYIEELDIK